MNSCNGPAALIWNQSIFADPNTFRSADRWRWKLDQEIEKWFRNFAQGDKWNFCLTAGTLVPANQERP
jgi:hypothetical protein